MICPSSIRSYVCFEKSGEEGSKEYKKKKIVDLIFWIPSVSLLFQSIATIFKNFAIGFVLIILSLSVIPPITDLIQNKFGLKMNLWGKIIIYFVGLILLGTVLTI